MASLPDQTPRPAETTGRYPDFFVVGHPKCGTTAIYEALRRHPQLFMPQMKEPNYYSVDPEDPTYRSASPGPVTQANDLGRYLNLFRAAGPDQVVGEGSVFYLWSTSAAERIAAVRPDARIVAVLREPASFLRSLYLQFAETGIENAPSFGAALEREDERRRSRPAFPSLLYADYIDYVEQVKRYERAFGADRVLVLIFDDLRADGTAEISRITRFLGVEDLSIEPPRVNPTVGVRSMRANQAFHRFRKQIGISEPALRALDAVAPRGTRRRRAFSARLNKALYGSPAEVDEGEALALRRRFAGEVVRISDHLGRDLVAEWGYEDLVGGP